jgi:hypothetical protein
MKLRAAGLVRAYKTALKSTGLRTDIEIKMCLRSLLAEELKVGRKKLKRHAVSGQITTLKAKTSKLTDFIRDVLSKLYSKHTLNLFDRCIRLYIYMTGDNLLNLFLVAGSSSFCSSVADICMH